MEMISREAKTVDFWNEILNGFEHVISVQTIKGICKVELNKNMLFTHPVNKALHSCFTAPRNTKANLHRTKQNQQAWP